MDEYIKREMALEAIDEYFRTTNPDDDEQIGVLKSRRIIRTLPPADVAPVRHGQWIMGTGENGLQRGHRECSRCGEIVKYGYSLYGVHNFCNYCGAKMDEEVISGSSSN